MGWQGALSFGEGLPGVVGLLGGLRLWEVRRLVWQVVKVLRLGAMLQGWQVVGSLRSPLGLLRVETSLDPYAIHSRAESLSSSCILVLSEHDLRLQAEPHLLDAVQQNA